MGDVQVAYIEYVQTYRVWGGREDRGLKFFHRLSAVFMATQEHEKL